MHGSDETAAAPETNGTGAGERSPEEHGRGGLSRRRLLQGAAGVVAFGGLGALGVGLDRSTNGPAATSPGRQTATGPLEEPAHVMFRSRPDLLPPPLALSDPPGAASGGLLLLTPSALPGARGIDVASQVAQGLGQPGAMITDAAGRLVWFRPTTGLATNLQVQSLGGRAVLTYWEGRIESGIGYGVGHVLDTSYREVHTVRAGHGLQADLHELQLTPQGTALVTAYTTRKADLSAINGPRNGTVFDSVVQEIDLETGKVLLDWRSLDHVPVTETYEGLTPLPFDYFHVNSVSLYNDNELLVSSRNTWALYRINRRTGAVIARINGKRSDYKMGPGTRFYWQHHSRATRPGVLTVFDDGATPAEEARSRAIVLAVDDAARTVELTRAYTHPANLLTPYEGSVQSMPDGGVFVGWGAQPYFSQFAPDGTLVLDGRFPSNDQSYRAFRAPWSATPASTPDVALTKDNLGQTQVHASWNGATEVASWQVRNGKSAGELAAIATVPKSGFETTIATRPTGKVFTVAALDRHDKLLAMSKVVTG